MRMEVNALDYAIEEVLFIECNNRQWRLVTFLSKSLNKIERNYEIYNKEVLVVIRELENWRHLLECKVQVQDVDWPQESGIIYEGAKVKQKTSLMSTLSIKIWLYSKIYTRNKNGKSR